MVIDIRSLNRITENERYPLTLQTDVTSTVAGYLFTSVRDAMGWFYQISVQKRDHKHTVVSHRGLEQSNVALMGFKGSPPYVQRQTDKLMRPYKEFAKAYVDNMDIYCKTFADKRNCLLSRHHWIQFEASLATLSIQNMPILLVFLEVLQPDQTYPKYAFTNYHCVGENLEGFAYTEGPKGSVLKAEVPIISQLDRIDNTGIGPM